MALRNPSNSTVLRCGLWGGASYALSDVELERIAQLGIMSQLRGTDSTGVLSCFHQGGKLAFKLMKQVGNSSEFIYGEEFKSHLKEKHPFLIAGHCRDATVGVVNHENAHPYNLGKIIGMKNGTVPSVPGRTEAETDSRALLRLLQESGIEVAARAADKGGCALVWADTRDLTLNFYRNIGRPIWIMVVGSTIYWASEYGMLALMRDRTGIRYDTAKIEILPVETHRKYRMHVGFYNYSDTKITVREALSYNLGQQKTTDSKDTTIVVDPAKVCAHSTTSTSVPITIPSTKTQLHETRKVDPQYTLYKIVGFNGLTMTPQKAASILKSGCAHCGVKTLVKDIETVKMFSKKGWLCNKCSGDPFAIMQAGAHNKELYDCKIITGKTNGHC